MHSAAVPALSDGQADHGNGNSLYAALARTLTRSATLYFSRPVRLFRPSKVSGWMFLQGLASQKGVSLSPQFLTYLVKKHGFFVLPRHFIPPLAVNVVLGTVLWSSYSEASSFLERKLPHPLAVSLTSGAIAGGAQAIVAAPAENVRLVLQGGGPHASWSSAWKDVFKGSESALEQQKGNQIREARQVRMWMKEVSEMAGRGWNGFGWGFAKDACGFAVFFSMFELTRRASLIMKSKSVGLTSKMECNEVVKSHIPRVVHGVSLVGGGMLAGLAYEMTARPFDEARRVVHAQRVADPANRTVAAGIRTLLRQGREDGIVSFFRPASSQASSSQTPSMSFFRRRMYATLRVLGRLGPWGGSLLIWEAFGPGLAP